MDSAYLILAAALIVAAAIVAFALRRPAAELPKPDPRLDDVIRARRPQHLPVVLTRDEVRAVLQRLDGVPRLMALLLYGAGLRLLECCRLRVKDIDFATN